MKILLINENPVVSKLSKLSAKKMNAEFEEVANLDAVEMNGFDIILIDNDKLSAMDINDIKSQIQSNQIGAILPKGATLPNGIDFIIEKPFLPTELIDVVLEKKRAFDSSKEKVQNADVAPVATSDEFDLDGLDEDLENDKNDFDLDLDSDLGEKKSEEDDFDLDLDLDGDSDDKKEESQEDDFDLGLDDEPKAETAGETEEDDFDLGLDDEPQSEDAKSEDEDDLGLDDLDLDGDGDEKQEESEEDDFDLGLDDEPKEESSESEDDLGLDDLDLDGESEEKAETAGETEEDDFDLGLDDEPQSEDANEEVSKDKMDDDSFEEESLLDLDLDEVEDDLDGDVDPQDIAIKEESEKAGTSILDKDEVDEIKGILNEEEFEIDELNDEDLGIDEAADEESLEDDIFEDESTDDEPENEVPNQVPTATTDDSNLDELSTLSEYEVGQALGEDLPMPEAEEDEMEVDGEIGGTEGVLSEDELALINEISDVDDDELPPVKSDEEVLAERQAKELTKTVNVSELSVLERLFSSENLHELDGLSINIKIDFNKNK